MSAKIFDSIKFSPTVTPQNDLFGYVNNSWINKIKIPADESRYGFHTMLTKQVDYDLRKIIAETIKKKKKSHQDHLLSVYYKSFCNTAQRNRLGCKPLIPYLEYIHTENNYKLLDFFLENTFPTFFVMMAIPHPFKSKKMVTYCVHTGLGLRDRDMYFKKEYAPMRNQYKSYIGQLFKLIGIASSEVTKVFLIEKKLAKYHLTSVESRDVSNVFIKINRNKFFNKQMNNIFDKFNSPKIIFIDNPKFFKYVQTQLNTADLKIFFIWKLVSYSAPFLSEKFVNISFNFNEKYIAGQQKQLPIWRQGLDFVNSALGDILGKKYVDLNFSNHSKVKATELIHNIRKATKEHIKNLDWMDTKTKKEALKKLAKLSFKVGHPKKFLKYDTLIGTTSLFDNLIAANIFEFNLELKKLHKPPDKDEWLMDPYEVNAYFSPGLNEMVFPAAILQPPFFDPNADDALNYGAIGVTIGHEITHAFDDQGRKYNAQGLINDWWTKKDARLFTKKAQVLVKQYNNYKLFDKHINGQLTLGENIADLGGLSIAFTAFTNLCKAKKLNLSDEINNKTLTQRFFISYSLSWRSKTRKKETLIRLVENPHAPAIYRVNGVVYNSPAFQKFFCLQKGDKLYNSNPLKIW